MWHITIEVAGKGVVWRSAPMRSKVRRYVQWADLRRGTWIKGGTLNLYCDNKLVEYEHSSRTRYHATTRIKEDG